MGAKLTYQNNITVKAIQIVCPFSDMQDRIAAGFGLLKSRLEEMDNRIDHTHIIGFYPQSPDTPNHQDCIYYLGVEIVEQNGIPDGMVSITIPSGSFVSYHYKGSLDSYVKTAYSSVNLFIKEHGLNHDKSRHILEIKGSYNDLHDRSKPDNEIKLMIPVS